MADQPDPTGPNAQASSTPPAQRPPGFRIGRVRGVPIYVSPLAVVFAVLVATVYADTQRSRLVGPSDSLVLLLATITAVGFLASILLHEIGHALVAERFELRVRSVTVHGFAGFTQHEKEPQSAGRQFLLSFSGPFVNGLLAGLCYLGLLGVPSHSSIGVVLFDLGLTNLLLFGFNLLPGLPLDGGGVVVAAVWRITHSRLRGLRGGAYGGFVVAAAVAVFTLRYPSSGFYTLYMLALAGFIGFGAYQSLRAADLREKLPDLRAGRLIRKTLPVDGSVPLAEALRHAQQAGATAIAVVDDTGSPSMIMNGASVDAMPEHRRPWVGISEVSRTIEPNMILDADLAGEELLNHIQRHPASEYLVTQNGRPVGVLVMVDLVARLDRNAAQRMVGRAPGRPPVGR
ncbi:MULTISPECIES: site-2 protease family protein [unclassified Pseudofrankia]|uniref:site-2 protease family protein n=1 Tax=unclassified Pseudofrankia TaxID=2994372 RepID=UPI0008D99EA9|nr:MULTISPECIES: site-2 protease family protein [unclassified Pseudofrankia]MDT3444712.1 peptidase M50 [Pseudofrankia sp. BMG5.37]OHV50354.1 peptidase M50 [Pseudofrankia sp. BMG5.36]